MRAAKKKPIDTLRLEDTGVDARPRLQVLQISDPPARKGGKVVKSVDELLEKLRGEAGVL